MFNFTSCLKLTTLLLATATLASLATVSAHAAGKGDDVFLDEGDGDFNPVPVVPSAPGKKETKRTIKTAAVVNKTPEEQSAAEMAAAAAQAAREDAREKAAEAKEAAVAAKEEAAENAQAAKNVAEDGTNLDDTTAPPALADGQPGAQPEAPVAAQAAPVENKAAPIPEKKHSKKSVVKKASEENDEAKPAKVAKAAPRKTAKGIYVVTQNPCPMTREPASESERMITVKASKRIWVEEVDEQWVRGFNKAGEPGYISRECVKSE